MKIPSPIARAEVAALLGVAGLEDDRLALRRALEVERPDHREVLAPVVERVLARAVEEDAGLLVAREGVVLVGAPQALRDLHVLERAAVAGRVVVVLVEAVVAGGAAVAARDDVPARAAAADDVERGEPPRDVERRVVRRRDRADQADAGRRDRERGEQRQRLEAVQVVGRRVRGDELAVDDEDEVELRLLELPRPLGVPVDVDARVAGDLGVQPRVADRPADAEQRRAELQLSSLMVSPPR